HGTPVYRLRGSLLPLVYLDRELDVRERQGPCEASREDAGVNIVVLRADDRQFGLVVDEINDTEEIVVKPLSQRLQSVNTFAGATIMGDGTVALILDVLGLAERAGVINEVRDSAAAENEARAAASQGPQEQRNCVLLFQYGKRGRMAIDLSQVARLEEFPA